MEQGVGQGRGSGVTTSQMANVRWLNGAQVLHFLRTVNWLHSHYLLLPVIR